MSHRNAPAAETPAPVPADHRLAPTLGGLAALACWSSTVALVRSVSESLGTVPGGAVAMLAGGLLGCVQYLVQPSARPTGGGRLVLRGGLFVAYQVGLVLAIGLSRGRADVLVVGALNYLWPVLSLVLSIPLLGQRATPLLVPGALLAVLGEVLVVTGTPAPGAEDGAAGPSRLWVHGLAAGAAVCWAAYSNLARRAAGHGNPVPLFLFLSGLVLVPFVPLVPSGSGWTGGALVELAFLAAVPQFLAYSLWDQAMAHGRARLVLVASYGLPVLSTALSCLYLGLQPGWKVWAGTLLLTVGAVVSYRAFERAGTRGWSSRPGGKPSLPSRPSGTEERMRDPQVYGLTAG